MKATKRKFDKPFKLMVVELVLSGKSTETVSAELGIKPDYVRRWVREHKNAKEGAFPGKGNQILTEIEKKVLSLEKELRDTKLENDILKKAVSIFSKRD